MEEKNPAKETIKISLWTYTALIVALIMLGSAVGFGWYYIFYMKNDSNNGQNQIVLNTIPQNQTDLNYIQKVYPDYVYNMYSGLYEYQGLIYHYNPNTQLMEEHYFVDENNPNEPNVNEIYRDNCATTIIKEKVNSQLSAESILKILYEDAYYIYNSQAGFEHKQDVIINYDEILNTFFTAKARAQYENWCIQNGRWQNSEVINITFKNIKSQDNKISATVVGDLLFGTNIIKKGLESKFSIEYNGTNWVIDEYTIPDTCIRDYVKFSGIYSITELSEITDKFSVKDLLPDYLQTQDYQADRYFKKDYENVSYENNSIRVIDLYHKNNYNKLNYAGMYIEVSNDKKSAKASYNGSELCNIENINGTIKKIFVGDIYETYMPVMLLEDGTVKIATYEYGKYYAKAIEGLGKVKDLRNVTITSFIKNSKNEYEMAPDQYWLTGNVESCCLIAITEDGKAYKIEYGGGGY